MRVLLSLLSILILTNVQAFSIPIESDEDKLFTQDFQEDSLKTNTTKTDLIINSGEFVIEQNVESQYVQEEYMEMDMEEGYQGEEDADVVSFNVFYYLLEKFKFSNTVEEE